VALRTALHKDLPGAIVLRFTRCTFTVLQIRRLAVLNSIRAVRNPPLPMLVWFR